jgi:inhibitor of KinA
MGKRSKQNAREATSRKHGALQCTHSEYKVPSYRVLPAGDTALTIELGEGIDTQASAAVLSLARRLDQKRLHGMIESVPIVRSLMVCYDPLLLPTASLVAQIDGIMRELETSGGFDRSPDRSWSLPVCYDRRFAPDLDAVAARTGLTTSQVIERHSACAYQVYMLGFLPGQAYMGDLPAELVLPRRETPRLRVAPGSLAIATTMTCIFPLETPCGWHVIGRSPVALWESAPRPRALLAPGDKVTFKAASLPEYEELRRSAAKPAAQTTGDARIGAAA